MINKKNPYKAQQEERSNEQNALTNGIMNNQAQAAIPEEPGQPATKIKRKVLSLSLTEEDKMLLQTYSLQHGQTAAATVHQWIQLHCK